MSMCITRPFARSLDDGTHLDPSDVVSASSDLQASTPPAAALIAARAGRATVSPSRTCASTPSTSPTPTPLTSIAASTNRSRAARSASR